MKENVYFGHIGIGETVKGEALVAEDNFSARYDLDRINGFFSRKSHKLFNQSYVNKSGDIIKLTPKEGKVEILDDKSTN